MLLENISRLRLCWAVVRKTLPDAQYADQEALVYDVGLDIYARCKELHDSSKSSFTHYVWISLSRAYRRAHRPSITTNEFHDEGYIPQMDAALDVYSILDKLSLEDRRVLILYYWGGQSTETLGVVLKCSKSTAWLRWKAAIENARRASTTGSS